MVVSGHPSSISWTYYQPGTGAASTITTTGLQNRNGTYVSSTPLDSSGCPLWPPSPATGIAYDIVTTSSAVGTVVTQSETTRLNHAGTGIVTVAAGGESGPGFTYGTITPASPPPWGWVNGKPGGVDITHTYSPAISAPISPFNITHCTYYGSAYLVESGLTITATYTVVAGAQFLFTATYVYTITRV